MTVTGADVARFMGREGDPSMVALASESVVIVTAIVRAYVRGVGFDNGEPDDALAAVITTATARVVTNPGQLPMDVGSVSVRGGFNGFTAGELAVLHEYRARAA